MWPTSNRWQQGKGFDPTLLPPWSSDSRQKLKTLFSLCSNRSSRSCPTGDPGSKSLSLFQHWLKESTDRLLFGTQAPNRTLSLVSEPKTNRQWSSGSTVTSGFHNKYLSAPPLCIFVAQETEYEIPSFSRSSSEKSKSGPNPILLDSATSYAVSGGCSYSSMALNRTNQFRTVSISAVWKMDSGRLPILFFSLIWDNSPSIREIWVI